MRVKILISVVFLSTLVILLLSMVTQATEHREASGSQQEVTKAYDKEVETDLQSSEAWYNKGTALAFQGNYKEALEAYEKALEIDPQNSDAWCNKGDTLNSLGNYEEAIKALNKAIEINPQDSLAWSNKGNTLALQGNYEEAIKAYDKAIEIDPQSSEAWYNKGTALGYLGYYEEAVKAFDEAIKIDPQFVSAWYNKGLSLEYSYDSEEAIKAYDKAIDIDSQYLDAWVNKGRVLRELGKYEEAIEACDKAIEIDSQNLNPWINKGLSLEYLGNYEEAINAFDKAIEINSQDSDIWTSKGTCLAHLGKYKEAVKALDKAIEIDPQHSEALSLKESILSNSNGLLMSLKAFFFDNNIFVEEDNLVEYAETYMETYEDIINKSNLTDDDLEFFSFYQCYPYSVDATISTSHGASIEFIPNSVNENKVTRVSYPIEELIPKITQEELNNNNILWFSLDNNSSNSSIYDININGGYIYVSNATNNCLSQCTGPIILAEGAGFNGITYIESNKLFREGEITINGTVVLNDSKVIVKSNLKKDWTKEKAEEDAIDFIYKEQIDGIFDYSKLTGIGFREIEALITDYKEKEMTGYYETNKYDKWSDRQVIFGKADQYGIPHESVSIELLDNKQEEKLSDKIFSFMDRFLTVYSFIGTIIVVIGLIKRKDVHQKLKNIFRN